MYHCIPEYFGSSVNCFVHIVLYFYYMVSALGEQKNVSKSKENLRWGRHRKSFFYNRRFKMSIILFVFITIGVRVGGGGVLAFQGLEI